MQNSLQASRSLYIDIFSCPNAKQKTKAFLERDNISAENGLFWSVVCCSLSKHSVKTIDESTFLVSLRYFLKCFVWNVACPSYNHTNSCIMMQNLVKSDAYLLSFFSTIRLKSISILNIQSWVSDIAISIDTSLGFRSWAWRRVKSFTSTSPRRLLSLCSSWWICSRQGDADNFGRPGITCGAT